MRGSLSDVVATGEAAKSRSGVGAGDEDDSHIGPAFPDLFSRCNAVALRHRHLHQHDVGRELLHEANGLLTVRCLPDNLDVSVRVFVKVTRAKEAPSDLARRALEE